MRKKIVIFGHYGVPNWGDEAILAGILSQINFTKFSVTVLSHNTNFTKKHHNVASLSPPPFGVRSFFRFDWIQTLIAIKEADYIIIGGGGLWQPRPIKALKLWNFYLKICLFFQKKVLSLGTSFGEITDKHIHEIGNSQFKKICKNLQKIKFFTVRDSASKKILQNIYAIHEAKISMTADAAFFLKPPKKKECITSEKKIILLSFREGDLDASQEKHIIHTLKYIFPEKKYIFRFVVMQSHQSHDEQFVIRNKDLFKNISLIFPKNTEDLREIISSAHFICSSRLHTNILASVCNTNFCAISCRDKVKNLFKTILPEHVIEANNITYTTKNKTRNLKKSLFFSQIQTILKNSYNFREKNTKFLEIQKKKLLHFFPDILL